MFEEVIIELDPIGLGDLDQYRYESQFYNKVVGDFNYARDIDLTELNLLPFLYIIADTVVESTHNYDIRDQRPDHIKRMFGIYQGKPNIIDYAMKSNSPFFSIYKKRKAQLIQSTGITAENAILISGL